MDRGTREFRQRDIEGEDTFLLVARMHFDLERIQQYLRDHAPVSLRCPLRSSASLMHLHDNATECQREQERSHRECSEYRGCIVSTPVECDVQNGWKPSVNKYTNAKKNKISFFS